MIKIICSICGKEYHYSRSKGHTLTKCGSCRTILARKRLKRLGLDFLGEKCSRCGYDKCEASLLFHHKNPKTKKFSLGSGKVLGWERFKEELKKCIILCWNCHMELHYPDSQTYLPTVGKPSDTR